MLHIQANAASGETAQALREAAERINLMARLYGRLGRQDGHAMVDAAVLLGDLLADLREGMDQLQPVGLFLEAEPLQLPVARAGSLGLVMNELVVRALKHAFPDGEREGTVKIALRRDGSEALLTVEDNGRGIAPASDSRGDIRLIRALAAQLGGHIESESAEGGGARCCLRFPVDAGSTAAPMPEPERALASISQAAS